MTKSNDENEALALSQQSMFDSRKTVRFYWNLVCMPNIDVLFDFFVINQKKKQFLKKLEIFVFSGRHFVYSGDKKERFR